MSLVPIFFELWKIVISPDAPLRLMLFAKSKNFFSYLISEKNLKENDCKEIYLDIIEKEKANGLSDEVYLKAKREFLNRYEKIDFHKFRFI